MRRLEGDGRVVSGTLPAGRYAEATYFGHYRNLMQVPKLERIVLNVGMCEATQNVKLLESAAHELGTITGQKPIITRAKKAIAGFKLRQGMPIGTKVTLRNRRMYEFFDRLVTLALPRIRDMSSEDGLFTESLMSALASATPEANERLRAFLEKRTARLKAPDAE